MNRSGTGSLNLQDYSVNQDKEPGIRSGKWIFIFIFGVWMFFLGVIFGRQTTPVHFNINDIETELARLKAVELLKEKKEIQAGIASLNEKSLDFYEDLKKGKPWISTAIPEKQNTPEIKRALSTKKNTEAINPEHIVESLDEKNPLIVNSAEPLTSELAGDNNKMNTGIQAASFVLLKDAENLVAALKKKGYSGAYKAEEDVPGVGIRYRVKVGFFKNRDDAQAVLNKLKNKENLKDAYIFKRKS